MFVLEVTFDWQCAPPKSLRRREKARDHRYLQVGTFIGRSFRRTNWPDCADSAM